MSVSTLARPEPVVVTFAPRNQCRALFTRRDPEILLSGPAGTGKTRACLERLHLAMCRYPGARALIVRKSHTDLTSTALLTFAEKVLHPLDGVTFYGGSAREPAQYRYPNGSRIMVGGLDRSSKIMSSEYDMIFPNEATELTENDWESLTTRLRHWVMPYQQLLGDCNPDAPTHWLKRRCDAGRTAMLETRHEDNPELFDERGIVTEHGAAYMAKLDALTGVRLLRLRKGIWAAAEGMVYDGWDPAVHMIDRLPIPADLKSDKLDPARVPLSWPRYWVVDFGYTNPFCFQNWCEDPDGRLYRYQEIYRTQRLVEDHARDIASATRGQPKPKAIICDHDAEGRATLERHLGLMTVPAKKDISPGIQAVTSRLRPAGDGRPRLFFLRDALLSRDPALADSKRPCCTEEEFESYVWPKSADGRAVKETPVDENNHGMDSSRYLCMYVDAPKATLKVSKSPFYG